MVSEKRQLIPDHKWSIKTGPFSTHSRKMQCSRWEMKKQFGKHFLFPSEVLTQEHWSTLLKVC